ncbi:FHA domain-containing serine/threonine-protein kinase [Lunatimonas salinarum]|uniref:FHA domain-containing serine/threonine-protein kinase n=1 Tax=Lunatimonas salinarum TaxID=1774590 RepID=UPI001ADED82F|nr:FHA domain-containing serine/threonine-protein kinase [Lunatimonas salinarum]
MIIGQTINNYKILKLLGNGGFGQVFLAEENITGELRAIKKLIGSENSQDDIIHEIRQVSKLKLAHTVMYFHHFWEGDSLHFVMEYCAEGTLHDKIRAKSQDPDQLLLWVKQLALTLQEIHDKGIVHKDIKPVNILFSDQIPKISDFGMANRYGGTRSYLSPQALVGMRSTNEDPREDVYALGVVLLESLLGWNPFYDKSVEEIIRMHRDLSYPIEGLPLWQQSIVLKAISRHPETRFQTMRDFAEALASKEIPFAIRKEVFDAGIISDKIKNLIRRRSWLKALSLVEFGVEKYPDNLQILEVAGNFYLDRGKVSEANLWFEKALRVNPRLNIQRQLGEIHLEQGNYAKAISFLSDHIQRNPTDLEAHNLLLKCFYLTNRLEAAIKLSGELLRVFPKDKCLSCNIALFYMLNDYNIEGKMLDRWGFDQSVFVKYNRSLFLEPESVRSYGVKGRPVLKSKLLFMDRKFLDIDHKKSTLSIVDSNFSCLKGKTFTDSIIKIGRDGFYFNDILISSSTIVSRRHAVIINQPNEIWLYDLDSFSGVKVNDKKVYGKVQLIGLSKIQVGNHWVLVNPDERRIV